MANAWSFSLGASSRCDSQTGQYAVSFTIDNGGEPEALAITASNRASVPVGSSVGARSSSSFSETLPGTTSGEISLTVSGNWPSDRGGRTRTASVRLAGDCVPPTPTPPPPAAMSDDCPNLDGIQGSVPEGMIRDDTGNCVPRPAPAAEAPPTAAVAPPAPVVTTTEAPPAQAAQPPPVTSGVAGASKTKSGPAVKKKGKTKAGGVKGKQAKVTKKKTTKKKKKQAGGVLPRTK